jgi:hypothetical protein
MNQPTVASAIAAIRKPLRKRLDDVCRERNEPLEVVVTNEPVMAEVFQYVWKTFPPHVQQQVDPDFFIQSCLAERHRLIGEVPRKKPLLQRLRERRQAKPETIVPSVDG